MFTGSVGGMVSVESSVRSSTSLPGTTVTVTASSATTLPSARAQTTAKAPGRMKVSRLPSTVTPSPGVTWTAVAAAAGLPRSSLTVQATEVESPAVSDVR